jgi:hypothetical protein
MYKIAIVLFLTTFLYASHPKIYGALGDVIYENVRKIESLKNLEAYAHLKEDIEEYVQEVQSVEKEGFKIESSKESEAKKSYLISLRKLSKQNDFFIRSAQKNYENSLVNQDSALFLGVVNSGLIDTLENKQEILSYYYEHQNEINTSGIIELLLQEDRQSKKQRDVKLVKKKTKEMKESEKIKRIRENDIQAQKKLEAKLQEELNKKKLEIRNNQSEELVN